MAEYIKREAALESICIACEYVPIDEKENCPYRFTGCQEYANIFAIPAADVKPVVSGKWHDFYQELMPDCYVATCGYCGKPHRYIGKWVLNYCPNCGADMRVTDISVDGKKKVDKCND